MLEVYSLNQTVATDATIPLNTTTIQKGCTAVVNGASSIQFNKCGVYMVSVDASATASAAGNIIIQLRKNGVLQPQAVSTATGTTTSAVTLGFTTLVQVPPTNNCCCSIPTTIDIYNASTEAVFNNLNVVVTKVC